MTGSLHLTADIPAAARSWRNNPKVWKWCRQHAPISEAAHAAWLQKIEHDPSIKMFGIWVNNAAIGVCGLTSISQVNQSAEFSLYIAEEHQRKGYGERALRVLLDFGFKAQNLNRIWGEVFNHNPAMKLFANIGFQQEGVLRQSYFREGRFIDSTIMSILRADWKC